MDFNLVAHEELKKMFGKQEHDGLKPKSNEHSTAANCDALLKLYKIVYAHPPNNGQYLTIFFKGWFAHLNGQKMN